MLVLKLPRFLSYRVVREKARQFQNKYIFHRYESVLIFVLALVEYFPPPFFYFPVPLKSTPFA